MMRISMLAVSILVYLAIIGLSIRMMRSTVRRYPWPLFAAGALSFLLATILALASKPFALPVLVFFGALAMLGGTLALALATQQSQYQERETHQSLRRKEVLSEISRRIRSSGDLDMARDMACNLTQQALDVDYTLLMEGDSQEGRLVIRSQAGWANAALVGASFRTEEGNLASRLHKTHEPMLIDSAEEQGGDDFPLFLRTHGIVNSVGCSFRSRSTGASGTISIHSRQQRQFSLPEIEFLSRLADALSWAHDENRSQSLAPGNQLLQEGAADLTYWFDTDESVLHISRRGVDLLGLRRPEGESLSLELESIHPPDICSMLRGKALPEARANGIWIGESEIESGAAAKGPIPVQQVILAHRDESDRVRLFTSYLFDQTHRTFPELVSKRAPAASGDRIKEMQFQLDEAAREFELFADSVSRSLKEPISAMSSFNRSLLSQYSDDLSPGAQRYLRLIGAAVRSAAGIPIRLGFAARLGKQPLKYSEVDMMELTTNVYDILAPDKKERKVEFTVRELLPAHGDESLLKHVMENLIANALKFTRSQTIAHIEVGSRVEGQDRVYYIQDNGIGFDSIVLDKLFGIFQRFHERHDIEGMGTGLFEVKRIIQKHRGRVWAQGDPNAGATFYFALPADPDELQTVQSGAA